MNYDIFKALVDVMPNPILIMNRELRIIYFNDSYKNISEKAAEYMAYTNCTSTLSKSTNDIIMQKYDSVFKEKETIEIEDYLNGKEIKVKLIPISNDYDEVTAAGCIYLTEENNKKKDKSEKSEKHIISLESKYKELKKLTYVDLMTKVYNRNYYEKVCRKIVDEKNFPLGVIMGDANGLKLVNDTLGHYHGDKLLKTVAKVLQETCSENDYIFRIGGDEFVILSPNTTDYKCEKLIKDIFNQCRKYNDNFIDVSISLGFSIINDESCDINDALKEAEDKVYMQKLLQKNSLSSSILNSLKISMEEKSYETEEHSNRVVDHSLAIGELISLPLSSMNELALVTSLHDIGKIGINESILLKAGNLTDEEFEIVKSHAEKGYRIVKASNQLDSVAKGVLTHHERWDGNGYPLKLKGEAIPLVARIVNIADAYDIMTTDTVYKKALTKREAIDELKKNSGYQFDPNIVDVFIKYLENGEDILKAQK